MPDAVNTVASVASGNAARAAAPAPSAPKASAPATASSLATQQVQPLSPNIKIDPMSGVMITEYLNSSGAVQSQIPSAVAVAYMRIGLTAEGLPKTNPNAAATQEQATTLVA
jgi:hypothetical protein